MDTNMQTGFAAICLICLIMFLHSVFEYLESHDNEDKMVVSHVLLCSPYKHKSSSQATG